MGIPSILLDDGPGSVAVEYGLLVALMAVRIIGVLTTVGEKS
jgi:Flp pilus assembly pilin Flp